MAEAYPIDLLDGFPGWSTQFELLWRQEASREAGGRTYAKDLGDPLWQATYQTRSLSPNLLDSWRARLDLLEGQKGTFLGYHLARCRPMKHPGSSVLPVGAIAAIGADRKTATLSGFAGITFSVGDMLQVGDTDLHRVVADGGTIEVRPHFWPGVAAGAAVTIAKPHCTMAIVRGSVTSQADPQTGRGAVSFQAEEAR